ncbi:MAG: RNA polymerase sigma factor, partial [Streptosporangiaceae bacterium]
MTELMSARHDADDARLLNMVRAGDSDAFSVLQERHEAAARRLARHLVASPYEVDDVVAEAFAWVLAVTRRGGGPSNAVRPYVLTALRRVCYYRLTGQPTWQRADDRLLPEPGEPFVEPSMAGLETALVARAYLSLPDRWRAVLWHAQVEQARPADIAPLLGLTRNGVAALDRRATEGLRQAYLQHHLSMSSTRDCRLVAERLDAFVRDPHAAADAATVSAHLDGCDGCRAIYAELADVSGTLRAVVAPLVLGPAAAAYLFGPGDSGAAASAGSGGHVMQAAVA